MSSLFRLTGLVVLLLAMTPALLWAGPPNVVLSHALHFASSDGTPVTLGPGKYFIEQAGPSTLRLTPEGDKSSAIIQAEPLTHEQYELFSPMALTRPQKDEGYLIELLLPGGIRLQARGSSKPPVEPPKTASAPITAPQQPAAPESQNVASPSREPIASQPEQGNPSLEGSSSPEFEITKHALTYHAPEHPSLLPEDKRVIVDERTSSQTSFYLAVLSPNHTGLTMFEQPVLFWFIAQPASQPVDVRIIDEGNAQILLDVRMLPPIQPGIHKIDLKDYGIRLQLNTTYQWTIILRGNGMEEDYTSSGWIMRISPPANLAAVRNLPSIESVSPRPLVEAGLWYDAVWVLSERIQAHPTDSTALIQRASLFEQVGLIPPANQDRSHLTLP